MNKWQPIETAPKDGSRFVGRSGFTYHETWWGKTSHVPLYGWCHGEVEDVDLWQPEEWSAIDPPTTETPNERD